MLVVAGSRGMSGAAFLTGKGALRSGVGLVTVACPAGVNAVLEVKTTCVMTRPLPETAGGALGAAALEPLRALIAGKSAVALGPGLSQQPETQELIRALVAEWPADGPPLVIDADGLNAFAGRAEELVALGGRAVLTPHPGEFRRLAGCSPDALADDRLAAASAFVAAHPVATLLKGHRTLVVAPGDRPPYENATGNPGMATAGSGDVLTGVVAALLAQGLPPFEAACLGAYLHGHAGDIAARTRGWAGLIATDVLEALPVAIRPLEEPS